MLNVVNLSQKVIFIIKEIVRILKIARYDDRTIVEHFRKQGAQIGEGCRILTRSLGGEPYLVKIGNHVTVAGDVIFATHDGAAWIAREDTPDIQVFGPIIIDDNCVIGHGTILFPNIRVGKNSIVGAGSVVISDIPPNCIAIGVPARVFGSVEKYREKCITRWEKQKPPDIVIEKGSNWWNSKHFPENRKKLRRHLIKMFWNRDEEDNI